MNPFVSQSPEIIKLVAASLSAFAALLGVWGKLGVPPPYRFALAVATGAMAFLIWPIDPATCTYTQAYAIGAVLLLLGAALGFILDAAILRRFSYTQTTKDDDHKPTKVILGGPVFTPAALRLQTKHPELTIQEIFERMDEVPSRVWERGPRTRLIVLQSVTAASKIFLLVLGFVAAASHVYLVWRTNSLHQKLTLNSPPVRTVIPGRLEQIIPAMRECRMGIDWTIEGSAEARMGGLLGELTPTGAYIAPPSYVRDIDLLVIATPQQHRDEFQQVKIQIRRHPEYSKPYEAEGVDSAGRAANFVIEVLDTPYSWALGENRLDGVDGALFVKRLAADGLLGGLQYIIAVGAASREYERISDEDLRALSRANTLGTWIGDALNDRGNRIFALKIGRYNDEAPLPPDETARERRVVIIGVLSADPGVNLLAALRHAFEQQREEEPLLGMYLDKYPPANWELNPVVRVH